LVYRLLAGVLDVGASRLAFSLPSLSPIFAAIYNFFYIASIKNDNSMSALTQNSDGHGQDRDSTASNQTRAARI
jgi:hypothetical protein